MGGLFSWRGHTVVGADAYIGPFPPRPIKCVGRDPCVPPPIVLLVKALSLRGRNALVAIRTPVPSAPLPKGGWHGEAVTGGFFPARTHGKCAAVYPTRNPSTNLRLVPLPLGKGGKLSLPPTAHGVLRHSVRCVSIPAQKRGEGPRCGSYETPQNRPSFPGGAGHAFCSRPTCTPCDPRKPAAGLSPFRQGRLSFPLLFRSFTVRLPAETVWINTKN